MHRSRFFRTFLLMTLVAGLLVASPWIDVRVSWRDNVANAIDLFGSKDDEEAPPAAAAEPFWDEGQEAPLVAPPVGAPMSFADLADAVRPAIVNIQATSIAPPEDEVEAPQRRFGFPFQIPRSPRAGQGTGFVISSEGYVITNNHVIDEFDDITVQTNDGRDLPAEVIGRDPNTDVALLKVDVDDLPALALGDSDAMRVGDWVIAVGNALGLENTVTAGIVSAKHRVINDPRGGQRRFDDFIQTDAAINPGNSGGPLLNLAGEVVGINTAIRQGANDVGFAVPINIAKQILPQLRAAGKVSRGWLGVRIQAIDDVTAGHLGIDDSEGALVAQVDAGSPADDAGFQRRDVIVEFDGKPVDTMEALPKLVAALPGGAQTTAKVIREGKRKTLKVTLGELDGATVVASRSEPTEPSNDYGLAVEAVTPEVARQLELEDSSGVVVSAITPDSPAAEAGLRRGDVILEVNKDEIESVRDFENAVEEADPEKGLLLWVRHRSGAVTFVPLKP